ncbi:hypothetical protein DYB36_011562, partial [Aphanomyces astaci]
PISPPAPASTTKDDDATKPSSDLVRRRPNPPSTPTVTNHVQVTSPPLATPDSLSLHTHAPRSTGPLASDSTPRPWSLVTWTSALQANLGDVATHGSAHTSLKQQFRAAKRRWRLADTRARHLLAIQSLAAHVALPDTDWAGAATADLRQLHRRMLRERMGADHPRLMVLPEVLQLAVPPPAPQFCNRLIRLQQQLPPHPFECFDALPDMSALSKAKLQRFMQPNADLEESCRVHEELVESAASVADIHEFGVHVVHVTHVLRSIVLHRAAAKEWLYRGYQHAVPAASDGPTAWQDTFHEWRDVVVDAVLPSALPRECHPLVQRTCDWYPYLLPSVLQWTRVMQTRSVETKHEEVPPLHDMVLSLLLSCKMPFPKLIEHHKLLQHHVKAFLVALAKQQVVEWAQLLVEHPDLRDLVVNENESVDEVGHVHLLPGFESPPHQLFDDDIPPCQTLSALAALAHQQARFMSVIGIDFGNVECVVAQAKRGGIDIILNENSNRKNPNMVCMAGKQRYIGEAAVSMARTNYKNTATDVKRLIGRKFSAPDVQEEIQNYGFKCVELPSGQVGIVLNYNDNPVTYSCEQVVAMMLNKLQNIAAVANDGVNPAYGVLSCPGYFTDVQRRAMLNASKIAGLNCLRLMNEHTAVALGYGIYKSVRNLFHETNPEHVMFIDMGHSGYTVSIVNFVQGKLQVKAVAYDRFLGGRNFDFALAKDVAEKFEAKHKKNPLADAKSRLKLLSACEKTKKNLSPQGVTSSVLNIECLVDEIDYASKVSLDEFETLIAPLLQRLEGPIQSALADAGLTADKLSCVEIVGGGVRVASVKRRLAEILGLDKEKPNLGLSTTLNADEAVARGCALQCAILSPLFKVKDFSISDINNYPIRVSWEGAASADDDTNEDETDGAVQTPANANSILILTRKDDFPTTKRITFRRSEALVVEANYDETATPFLPPSPYTNLGKFTISGMSAGENGEAPRVRVNVRQDIHGLFEVASGQMMVEIKEEETKEAEAKEGEEKKEEGPKKKRFRKVDLKVESQVNGLTAADVNRASEEELTMAQQDRVIEETANKRNELETFVYDNRNHLSDKYSEFVSTSDRDAFDAKLNDMEDWLYSDEGFDSTKSVFQTKLDELRALLKPVDVRYQDHQDRPEAQAELKAVIEEYKKLANSTDDAYSHWTDDESNKLRDASTKAETWLFDQLNAQANVPLTQDPVVTADQIRKKIVETRALALPIITKPKPLPKVEPPAAPVTSNDEDTKEGDKMDLD